MIHRFSRPALAGLIVSSSVLPLLLGGALSPLIPPGTVVLGEEEPVEIFGDRGGDGVEARADVDTGATYSSIDDDLARELDLNLEDAKVVIVRSSIGKEYRPLVEVRLRIGERTLDSEVTVADRDGLNNQVLVGRRDLSGFLVRVEGDRYDRPDPGSEAPGPRALLAALPLAALPGLAIRSLAGLPTLGLLSPVLLALAFVSVGPPAGLLVAGAALVPGLLGAALFSGSRSDPRRPPLVVGLVAFLAAGALLLGGVLGGTGEISNAPPAVLPLLFLSAALVVERLWDASRREGAARALEATCWTLLAAVAAGALLVAEPVMRVAESTPVLPAALTVAAALLVWLLGGRPGDGVRKETPR